METIILASGSPRRRELLTRVKIPFKAVPPRIPEDGGPRDDPVGFVVAVAGRKVEEVVRQLRTETLRWVLGVDTVVEIDGRILGKPTGIEDAEAMLRLLSGRTHRVHSGVALLVSRAQAIDTASATTDVTFRELAEEELGFYLETGEWAGVAGSYRIQERGVFLVDGIRGSWSNVVGLPLEVFYGMLRRNGYPF